MPLGEKPIYFIRTRGGSCRGRQRFTGSTKMALQSVGQVVKPNQQCKSKHLPRWNLSPWANLLFLFSPILLSSWGESINFKVRPSCTVCLFKRVSNRPAESLRTPPLNFTLWSVLFSFNSNLSVPPKVVIAVLVSWKNWSQSCSVIMGVLGRSMWETLNQCNFKMLPMDYVSSCYV